jgi:hypothetical protein
MLALATCGVTLVKYIGFYGVGNVGCHFDNCGAYGALDAGFVIENDVDGKFTNTTVHIDNGYRPHFKKAGRNEPCPCGSGVKFKRCHGGSEMSRGIVSKNGQTTYGEVNVTSSGDGVVLENDRSTFAKLSINAGVAIDYAALAEQLNLPKDVPLEFIKDAIQEVRNKNNPAVVEQSKLKIWLNDNGFNMGFWAQVALSLVTTAFQSMS